MAVIRLDDELDNIEKTLTLALFNSTSNNATSKSISTIDSLASSTWEQVTKTSLTVSYENTKGLIFIAHTLLFTLLLSGCTRKDLDHACAV